MNDLYKIQNLMFYLAFSEKIFRKWAYKNPILHFEESELVEVTGFEAASEIRNCACCTKNTARSRRKNELIFMPHEEYCIQNGCKNGCEDTDFPATFSAMSNCTIV